MLHIYCSLNIQSSILLLKNGTRLLTKLSVILYKQDFMITTNVVSGQLFRKMAPKTPNAYDARSIFFSKIDAFKCSFQQKKLPT